MTEATGPENQTEENAAAQALAWRKWRMRRHCWRVAGLLIAAPFVFALIVSLSLLNREVTAPSWIKSRIEQRASTLLNGGSLVFDRIVVTLGTDLHPRVRLQQAQLRDASGLLLAQVPQVESLLSPRGLLKGEILAQEMRLSGAEISLHRAADGNVELSFNSAGPAIGAANSFADLMDLVDQSLEGPELSALEQVQATGLIINYTDARAGRSWIIDGGRVDLDLRNGKTAFSSEVALLSGRSYLTTMSITYESPRASRAAIISTTIKDAVAAELATQSPELSWLSVLDAPISATLRGEIDQTGNIGPLSAVLELGAGSLRPTEQTRPVHFDAAQAYLSYLPSGSEIRFDQLQISSNWGQTRGHGKAYLRDFQDGWPNTMLGQFEFDDLSVNPNEMFPEPVEFDTAIVDFQLEPDPFVLTIGQAILITEDTQIHTSGEVLATPEGWALGLDSFINAIDVSDLMQYWPPEMRQGTRRWFDQNLLEGQIFNATVALRSEAQDKPQVSVGFEFANTSVRFMRDMPVIENGAGIAQIDADMFTLVLDQGQVTAPQGGRLDLARSVMHMPNLSQRGSVATFALRINSTITAALSILEQPPLNLITRAGIPVDVADGRAEISGALSLPFVKEIPRDAIQYSFAADLTNLRSDQLIQDRVLAAAKLELRADNRGMSIQGPSRIGAVPMDGSWSQSFEPGENQTSHLEAVVELSSRFLDEFNIALPPGSLAGTGYGNLSLDMTRDQPPQFSLSSDLAGIRLAIPSLGWSKSPSQSGQLSIAGTLGEVPRISQIALRGAGLEAQGDITLRPGGGLDQARFPRLRVGDWLNTSLTLQGQGVGQPPIKVISGGSLDLRRAALGGGDGAQGGPTRIQLDRLQVSQGIALTDFAGDFTDVGGFSGQFTALVNQRGPVRGTIVPIDQGSAIRIRSDQAGEVVAAAGLLENGRGGTMDLTLRPDGPQGHFRGDLEIQNIRVRNAPALAGLLDAISVVGLLQQLDGQGLAFSNVDAEFHLRPGRVVITRSSAIGASMGISLDGVFDTTANVMNFQGVVSPFYLLNGIGSILTRPGEGLIGFNFTLSGPSDNSRVAVNPLSVFTPGMFREIFRRPPPEVQQ